MNGLGLERVVGVGSVSGVRALADEDEELAFEACCGIS